MYPKEDFIIWGSGKQYRDFIYVDDVIDALLRVAEIGMGKGVIQIGSGRGTSIKELAEYIVKISKKDIKIKFDTQFNEGDKGRVAIIEKAKKELYWEPKISLEEGLLRTYKWIEKNIKNENSNH
jgi:nucleoside-diphosphate-sugar epimerase